MHRDGRNCQCSRDSIRFQSDRGKLERGQKPADGCAKCCTSESGMKSSRELQGGCPTSPCSGCTGPSSGAVWRGRGSDPPPRTSISCFLSCFQLRFCRPTTSSRRRWGGTGGWSLATNTGVEAAQPPAPRVPQVRASCSAHALLPRVGDQRRPEGKCCLESKCGENPVTQENCYVTIWFYVWLIENIAEVLHCEPFQACLCHKRSVPFRRFLFNSLLFPQRASQPQGA